MGKKKTPRAADEGIAAFIKAKHLIGGTRNADADSFSDGPGRMADFAQPERAGSAKVEAVVAAVDLKGGSKPSGSAGEIEKPSDFAIALHELDAIEGFECADENRRRDSRGLAHDIQHKMRAVIEENICMPRSEIHRANARSRAAEMMPRRIAGRISFGFHDAAAKPACGKIADDNFSNKKASELDGVRWKFGTAEVPNRGFLRRGLQGHARRGHGTPSQRDCSFCRSSAEMRS
jgi:hypothetical protein